MLIGEFTHSLDKKGRVLVPSKFRSQLAGGAVVTRGFDDCLFLYPKSQWQNKAEELASAPVYKSDVRACNRHMLAGAMDVELDSQGRILLPGYLRDYADLSDKVVIAGLYNRLEMWNKDQWTEYKKKIEKNSDEIAEKLGELEMF